MRRYLHMNTLDRFKIKFASIRRQLTAFCILYSLLLVTTLTSCKTDQKRAIAEKPTVSVTIEPFRYFVEQIAGDKVNINVMVPVGNSPETYEPTPQQMIQLSHSILYFKVGQIGFEETWMKKLTENAPEMEVIDTSTGITPTKTAGGFIDPHTWMSCQSARVIADNICKALCKWMPKDSTYFSEKCHRFKRIVIPEVEQQMTPYFLKAKEAREKLIQKKESRFPFVIYHPALTYFAKDGGFEQLPIEEEGREPSISQLQALINRARRDQIKTVFIQKEFANRNTQTFIDATGANAIEIHPLTYQWNQEMVEIAKKIAESYGVRDKISFK